MPRRAVARIAVFLLALAICVGGGWQAGRTVAPNGIPGVTIPEGALGHQH
jgi:hypothetical protein